jgi:type I restriction enzyme M protein
LPNIIYGDTLTKPYHKNKKGDRLAQFDYIVNNTPFNTDFSDNRDELADEKHKKRFFAGVPNIPNQDKDSMAIYLMFLQHIIHSLGDNGKAAIVVPTGFLTASNRSNKIAYAIREHLVRNRMLRGVISMPSNIFATTGTNVSIIFIDKEKQNEEVILMDASKLGTKEKLDGKNQKTVLSPEEITKIIDTLNFGETEDGFCIKVSITDLEAKKLSFSAGQYFEAKIEYTTISHGEFVAKIAAHRKKLRELSEESNELSQKIDKALKGLSYDLQ